MFGALAWLIHLFFPQKRAYWIAFAMASLGGGVATYLAATTSPPADWSDGKSFYSSFTWIERNYHWWFMSVFRNIVYPLELFYHALFFIMIALLLLRRTLASLFIYALGLASNPFLGVQMTTIVLPVIALDLWVQRSRKSGGMLGLATTLFLAFIAYYKVFLNAYPVARSLQAQHESTDFEYMHLADMFKAYGPFLIVTLASLADRKFLRRQWKSRSRRLLIIWILGTLALTHHTRILNLNLQPMHFERGYLFLGIVIWGFQYLSFRLRGWVVMPSRVGRRLVVGLALLVLALTPDSFAFLIFQGKFSPTHDDLVFDRDGAEVLRYFKGYSRGRVLVKQLGLSKMMTAWGDCPTLWADGYTTPFFKETSAAYTAFVQSGDFNELRGKYGITAFVLLKSEYLWTLKEKPDQLKQAFPDDRFQITLANEKYVVIEILPSRP